MSCETPSHVYLLKRLRSLFFLFICRSTSYFSDSYYYHPFLSEFTIFLAHWSLRIFWLKKVALLNFFVFIFYLNFKSFLCFYNPCSLTLTLSTDFSLTEISDNIHSDLIEWIESVNLYHFEREIRFGQLSICLLCFETVRLSAIHAISYFSLSLNLSLFFLFFSLSFSLAISLALFVLFICILSNDYSFPFLNPNKKLFSV